MVCQGERGKMARERGKGQERENGQGERGNGPGEGGNGPGEGKWPGRGKVMEGWEGLGMK